MTAFYVLIHVSALNALFVVGYGGWHWVRGTSTEDTESLLRYVFGNILFFFVCALLVLVTA